MVGILSLSSAKSSTPSGLTDGNISKLTMERCSMHILKERRGGVCSLALGLASGPLFCVVSAIA